MLKTQAGEDLAQAIQQVSRGGFYVGAGVSQAVVDACRAAAAEDRGRLTSRERQVVQLVAEGKSTKQGRAARDHPQDRGVSPLAGDEKVEHPRCRGTGAVRDPGRPDHSLTRVISRT